MADLNEGDRLAKMILRAIIPLRPQYPNDLLILPEKMLGPEYTAQDWETLAFDPKIAEAESLVKGLLVDGWLRGRENNHGFTAALSKALKDALDRPSRHGGRNIDAIKAALASADAGSPPSAGTFAGFLSALGIWP